MDYKIVKSNGRMIWIPKYRQLYEMSDSILCSDCVLLASDWNRSKCTIMHMSGVYEFICTSNGGHSMKIAHMNLILNSIVRRKLWKNSHS